MAPRDAPPTPDRDGRAAEYFSLVCQSFERASRTGSGPVDRGYRIAGHIVRLRFPNAALVPILTPAFEHLAVAADARPVALTVCVWDSASTGTPIPPPAWSETDDLVIRGEVPGLTDARFSTAYHLAPGVLSMLDRDLDLAVYWIRDAAQVPYYERGAPLRTILHWWMSDHRLQLVHAAAVGTEAGGVLLGGKGGSGKSTTALACLQAGLSYASDDHVLLATEPTPRAHSLYSASKLADATVRRFADLETSICNVDRRPTEKALVFLNERYPERMISSLPIRALLLPRVTGRAATTVSSASPMAALSALAPSTIFELSGAGRQAFGALARFVRQVPSFHLDLGTDIQQVPGVIANLLSAQRP